MSFFCPYEPGAKEKMKADRNTDNRPTLSAFRAVFIFSFACGDSRKVSDFPEGSLKPARRTTAPYTTPPKSDGRSPSPQTLLLSPHNHHLLRRQSRLHQPLDLLTQKPLMLPDHIHIRLRHRMLRHKDRTAILKRQYRSLISPNLLRSIISGLSIPISGRYTGIVQTSFVAARDCIV